MTPQLNLFILEKQWSVVRLWGLLSLGLLLGLTSLSCAPNYRDSTGVSPFDSPYPNLPKTASARARILSGGKITSLKLLPGQSLDDCTVNWLLAACRYINLPGHTAKSVTVKFTAGGLGPTETYGLEVGKEVLIDIGGVEHDGFNGGSGASLKGQKIKRDAHSQWIEAKRDGQYYVFADQTSPTIVLNPNSKIAEIGTTRVTLKYPVIWILGENEGLGKLGTSGQTIMTLSDFMTLVRKRNVMLGWTPNSVVVNPRVVDTNEFSYHAPASSHRVSFRSFVAYLESMVASIIISLIAIGLTALVSRSRNWLEKNNRRSK